MSRAALVTHLCMFSSYLIAPHHVDCLKYTICFVFCFFYSIWGIWVSWSETWTTGGTVTKDGADPQRVNLKWLCWACGISSSATQRSKCPLSSTTVHPRSAVLREKCWCNMECLCFSGVGMVAWDSTNNTSSRGIYVLIHLKQRIKRATSLPVWFNNFIILTKIG